MSIPETAPKRSASSPYSVARQERRLWKSWRRPAGRRTACGASSAATYRDVWDSELSLSNKTESEFIESYGEKSHEHTTLRNEQAHRGCFAVSPRRVRRGTLRTADDVHP